MTQTTSPAPSPSSAFWPRFRALDSLRRSSDHRAVAGVAEGLSRHFDIDAIIVRVLFGALTFFGGAGLILYGALWLTVPNDATGQSLVSGRLRRDPRAWTTIGLAGGGIFAAAAALGSLSWAAPRPYPFLLCAVVVVLGMLVLTRKGDRAPQSPPSPTPPMSPPPGSAGTPAPTWTPGFSTAPTFAGPDTQPASDIGANADTEPAAGTPTAPRDEEVTEVLPGRPVLPEMTVVNPYPAGSPVPDETRAWWQRDDPGSHGPSPVALSAAAERRPRSHLFGLTLAVIAMAEALVWIVDASTSTDVNPSVYPGVALSLSALGLLVSAWWGRARGLIALGLVAGVLTAGAAFAGPGPYGERSASPHQASALQSTYRMGIGRFTLDLEQVRNIEALQGRSISLNQRIGQLRVVIPSSVAAMVDATVDHGSVDGPATVQSLDEGGERARMRPDPAGRPVITVHLHVAYGDIRIERVVCPGAAPVVPGETTSIWNEGSSYVPPACT
jgi:phage shock protein PspC (stress-responsive transcriptional regulator)